MSSKAPPPAAQAARSAVPEPVDRLAALFAEFLPDVAFPGVDAARLESLVQSVVAHAAALAAAEVALAEARDAHARVHAELMAASKQALGYARVYAAGDPPLLAALADVQIGPPASPSRVKKAPRKPRAVRRDNGVTKLPLCDAEATSGAA
jgi:hypothetical protein